MDVKKNIFLNDTPWPCENSGLCGRPSERVITFSAGFWSFGDSGFAEPEIKKLLQGKLLSACRISQACTDAPDVKSTSAVLLLCSHTPS